MAKSPREELRRKAREARPTVAKLTITVERSSPPHRRGGFALVRLEGTGLELAEVRYPDGNTERHARDTLASLSPHLERALREALRRAIEPG